MFIAKLRGLKAQRQRNRQEVRNALPAKLKFSSSPSLLELFLGCTIAGLRDALTIREIDLSIWELFLGSNVCADMKETYVSKISQAVKIFKAN